MKDFIELIKQNALKFPDRIAVIERDRKISYGDFLNLVNSISHKLIANNIKSKVVFDLKQGVNAYALIVAVLNVGGIYCPLNPDAPLVRKLQIVNEFTPDFIVIEKEENISDFNSANVHLIEHFLANKNDGEINRTYDGEDIIYVIYTSGSTGMPKGVMICRKALNKFLEWSIPTYAAGENDIWAQYSYLSFDLSIVDIFTCLCSGATLYVINDDSSKSLPSSVIEKAKITIWHSSPIAINSMIRREKSKISDLSSLKVMSFCGAPLTKAHVEFLFSKSPNLTIYNTYGPTEGTLFCTWQKITSLDYNDFSTYTISLGKTIPGWNIHLRPINKSSEFEVIIYGDYIGKGYSREIIESGFSQIDIEGKIFSSFATGDIVYETNGNIFFDSRKDRQVKINDNRVELAGIEYHLQDFLKTECVVLFYNNKLYCFVETNETIDKASIMTFLSIKLLIYEIPKIYFPICKIPMSPNSKIDFDNLIKLITE